MENELKKLMELYNCSFAELAPKIGCSLRTLYRLKNNDHIGKFLRDKVMSMYRAGGLDLDK